MKISPDLVWCNKNILPKGLNVVFGKKEQKKVAPYNLLRMGLLGHGALGNPFLLGIQIIYILMREDALPKYGRGEAEFELFFQFLL